MKVHIVTFSLQYCYEREVEEKVLATQCANDDFKSFILSIPGTNEPKREVVGHFYDHQWKVIMTSEALGEAVSSSRCNGANGDFRLVGCEPLIDIGTINTRFELLVRQAEDAARSLTETINKYDECGQRFNDHAKAPIVDNHLLSINRMCLLSDACTDELQAHLDAGWRIVAVSPQASRRPDYILGRDEAVPLKAATSRMAERGGDFPWTASERAERERLDA